MKKYQLIGLPAAALALLCLTDDVDAQIFRRPQPVQGNTANVRVIGRNNNVTVQQSNAHGIGGLAPAGIQRVQTLPTHAYVSQQALVNPAYRGSLNVVNSFTSPVLTSQNIRYMRQDVVLATGQPTAAIVGNTAAYVQAPCPPPVTASTEYVQTAPLMQQLQQAYVQVPAQQQVVVQPQVQYQEVQQVQQVQAVQQPVQTVQYVQNQQEVQYVQPSRVVQREVSYQTARDVQYVQTQHANYECAPQNIVAQRRQFIQHCPPGGGHRGRRG